MNQKFHIVIMALVCAAMLVTACAPAPAPTASPLPTATATLPAAPTASATAGCAPVQAGWNPATAEKGSRGMTVVFDQEPDQAVALFSNMTFAAWLWQIVGVGPGKWDDKNNLVPYAAADIPSLANGGIAVDGLTVTWKLKPCLFWSDGQPITSGDLAFTWKAMVDPHNAPGSRAGWEQISGIDTPDAQTAIIHFKSIYPAWPTLFDLGPNNRGSGILPEHIFRGQTQLEKNAQVHQPTWAGGPFAIKEWIPGNQLTLVRNPNYFGDKPKLDYIDIKFVTDPATGLAMLKSAQADLMVNLEEPDIPSVQDLANSGTRLRVDPAPDVERLFFNLGTTKGQVVDGNVIGASDVAGFCPFQDVNVRKAIMLGINRLAFIQDNLKEDQRFLTASLWPNSYWYNSGLAPYPYDPAQANQLLDAAGYKAGPDGIRAGVCNAKPVKFSLGIETTNAPLRVDGVTAIRADLKQIGIDIKPNAIPIGTFFDGYEQGADLPRGKFDMAIFTERYFPDPDAASLWGCANVPNKDNPGGTNVYHLCDPALDQLFAQGLSSADPVARQKTYEQVQQYMYDNVLVVPLYARANVYAYSDRLVFPPTSGYSSFGWDAEYFDVK